MTRLTSEAVIKTEWGRTRDALLPPLPREDLGRGVTRALGEDEAVATPEEDTEEADEPFRGDDIEEDGVFLGEEFAETERLLDLEADDDGCSNPTEFRKRTSFISSSRAAFC